MHKLTKLLSFRLYLVDYDISIDKLDQSSSNNNESVNHRHSILVSNLHRNSSSNTNPTGASNGNNKSKVRSRHLSMQSRGGHSPKRGINRPLSATGGSEGQIDTSSKQPPSSSSGSPISEDASPLPEGSMSTMLRNISSASLSDLANTFKPDRKSTHLTEEDDEHAKQKFGIKNITGSFSNTPSSHSITSNSSKKNPPAVGGRRTISIQQLDTLWQDSGSKLLNFVHHAEPPVKPEWDKKSESSTEESLKSNGSSWFTATAGESLAIVTNPTAVTDKLPAGLGTFKSSEFLVLSNLSHDGPHILSIWKNMLLAVGNINQIEVRDREGKYIISFFL
jgi:hypothetical protein